jgi:phospholipid/cholesterol/gamma-HCH transport system substrate-binding protein
MAERTLRLRLGLFVGGSLIALAGLVVLFGGSPRLFSTSAKYAILFPEAPGIAPGTPIRKSGVRIGDVTALELDPVSGQVRVLIAVDRKYLPRKSEEPTISRGLLSGDTAIDFLPKLDAAGKPVPRADEWPPGSEIPGAPPLTPRSFLNPATAALTNAQQQLDKITKTFERFEQAAPKIERAADEAADLFKEIRLFIPELRRTNQKLQNLIGADPPPPRPGGVVPIGFMAHAAQPPDAAGEPNLRTLIREAQEAIRTIRPALEDFRLLMRKLEPDLGATVKSARQAFDSVNEVLSPENRKEVAELLKNLNAVSANIIKFAVSLNAVLDAADKTIKNIDAQVTQAGLVVGDVRAITKPLAARSESLVASVADSAEELSKLIVDVRGVVGAFAKENGTVQKLITDPTVYRNLDDAAASLARILARSEKITRDLEVFADKVARRPELIGIGGALRPCGGLKDLPGAPSYRPDWPPASSARPFAGPSWLAPDGPPPPVQGYKP